MTSLIHVCVYFSISGFAKPKKLRRKPNQNRKKKTNNNKQTNTPIEDLKNKPNQISLIQFKFRHFGTE